MAEKYQKLPTNGVAKNMGFVTLKIPLEYTYVVMTLNGLAVAEAAAYAHFSIWDAFRALWLSFSPGLWPKAAVDCAWQV